MDGNTESLRDAIRKRLAVCAEGTVVDARAVAQLALGIWQQLAGQLEFVIGVRGVDVLFNRALNLTSAAGRPWLGKVGDQESRAASLANFTACLAGRETPEAIEAGSAFLLTFAELLASLVGPSVAARVTGQVWRDSPSISLGTPLMSRKVTIHRLATGVPGLDTILGGGLPEFSFNLIIGPPGAGKTTLAHQIMFALATLERPALFFTVEGEPPLKMLRYQQQFSFFDADQIDRSIHYIDVSDGVATGDFAKVLAQIRHEVEAFSPALVFVDSFRSVTRAARDLPGATIGLQEFVQHLGTQLAGWQATSFLIGQHFSESVPQTVFTVADGLLSLEQDVHRNSMVRKLQVLKMRGQPTSPGLHTMRISGDGIEIFPAATIRSDGRGAPASAAPRRQTRLSMGVSRLDEMLGGGLPAGYSLLVAGPSGSGKTILATAFLTEGVRRGEAGVIVAFEQTPSQSWVRTLDDMVRAGQIGLINTRSLDLSMDEIVQHLVTLIGKMKASRVVIDSLSGFELALAPSFREDFRESLFRMVAVLSGLGVTVLMTSELEDRYIDLRFSPYGSAFLTDAIIVQRYIELESRLKRVMAVVKVRASAHSNEIRQFEINDEGIVIGAPVLDYEGLLGGRPTAQRKRRDAAPPDSASSMEMS